MSTSTRDEEIASGLPENLDALPRLNGFRLRGIEMTRLETFIDAAFAFAVTMVVIAADRLPDDIVSLLAAFKNVPSFVASVVVLGIFWRGHWLWSCYISGATQRRFLVGTHADANGVHRARGSRRDVTRRIRRRGSVDARDLVRPPQLTGASDF